ncbi:MAG: hypothetical protein ACQR33_02820 [Candidatus Saccharibacteria bacterium]
MATAFFERRISSARGTDSLAADIMRHVHSRQHLGKTIVVCESPVVVLSAARKQWLKLSRTIQKQRASTLNADKILKYTHAITRMQHMNFTMKMPLDYPEADIFFLHPSALTDMPVNSYNLYLLESLEPIVAEMIAKRMPQDGLIVDYVHDTPWETYGLQPKTVLEERVRARWHEVTTFLELYDIEPKKLRKGLDDNIEAMDDALDTLLNVSQGFIDVANHFQRSLELARPLKIPVTTRLQYDTVVLLAHRVQALSVTTYSQRFLESYNEDDAFFFYDRVREHVYGSGESLAEVIARHQAHGRLALAQALTEAAFLRSDQRGAKSAKLGVL